MIPNIPENIASLKISNPTCFSDNESLLRINLTKVTGAV
jgi:hypothetical protein